MSILPEWLVNLVLKQLGGYIFERIIKQAQNFEGSVWDQQRKRDAQNPFYPWLHRRISAWLARRTHEPKI